MKNPSCHAHIWSKKRRFFQSYNILWPEKVNRIPFFLIFLTKITALTPIFCKKKRLFSKNKLLYCHFFQLFMKKFPAAMPIFGLENVDSIKRTLYYGPKKSMGCPFFPIFMKKSMLSCPYFINKTSILWNRHFSHAHILLKNVNYSLKNTKCSHVIFFNFVM